jgi:hypothetical protein
VHCTCCIIQHEGLIYIKWQFHERQYKISRVLVHTGRLHKPCALRDTRQIAGRRTSTYRSTPAGKDALRVNFIT